MTYREGMSRDAMRIWQEPPEPPEPLRPSAVRCTECGYRVDAPGHRFACGDSS